MENAYFNPVNVLSIVLFGPVVSYKIIHFLSVFVGAVALYAFLKKKGFRLNTFFCSVLNLFLQFFPSQPHDPFQYSSCIFAFSIKYSFGRLLCPHIEKEVFNLPIYFAWLWIFMGSPPNIASDISWASSLHTYCRKST